MKFTVQANKGDNNSPVLDRNFTFTDKMTGDYAYTGNLVIEAKNASGKTQWTDIISLDDSDKQTLEHGTFTWNTDGGWTYKAAQAGEFVYYLTYYAKPTANGHNHIRFRRNCFNKRVCIWRYCRKNEVENNDSGTCCGRFCLCGYNFLSKES